MGISKYTYGENVAVIAMHGNKGNGYYQTGVKSIPRSDIANSLVDTVVADKELFISSLNKYNTVVLNYDEQTVMLVKIGKNGTDDKGCVAGVTVFSDNIDLYFHVYRYYTSRYDIDEMDIGDKAFAKCVSNIKFKPTLFNKITHKICIVDFKGDSFNTKYIGLNVFKSLADNALLKDNNIINNIIAFNADNIIKIAFNSDSRSICLEDKDETYVSLKLAEDSFIRTYNALMVS